MPQSYPIGVFHRNWWVSRNRSTRICISQRREGAKQVIPPLRFRAFARDHFTQSYCISFFISRTARSSPTMIAREMMLCPMFSSHMLGIAATGPTLR